MVSSYFPQLSADDVDAIAEQIGALSVDEVAAELESWLAQLDAEAEARRTGAEEDDYNYASLRYDYFPQVEDEKIDAIANQVGALSIDEVAAEIESWLAQLEDEKIDAIADQVGALSVDEVVAGLEGLFA